MRKKRQETRRRQVISKLTRQEPPKEVLKSFLTQLVRIGLKFSDEDTEWSF